MSKGSYRGGSTSMGWNANRYVSPSLTGRTRSGKALIKDLTARTSRDRADAEGQDERARRRHGLGPAKVKLATPTAASTGKSGVADAARKRLKAGGRAAFTITVVKRKRPKRAAPS